MAFKLAQTFYLDKTTVRNAEHITLTSIDLYFRSKPQATKNRSGIKNPGVSLYILQTRDDDVPDTARTIETAFTRCEYDEIIATSDASVKTNFTFAKPVILKTNKSYAIAVAYDGDEDFRLWTCREGEVLVGTTSVTSGAKAKNVGKYYEYSSVIDSTDNVGATIQEQWKPLKNVDLKFRVQVGVYAANTASKSVTTTYLLPMDPTEYILYDRYHDDTSNRDSAITGEMVFQETPVIYGSVVVRANTTKVTTSGGVNFSTLLTTTKDIVPAAANSNPIIKQKSYIVLRNGTDQSANVCVREVMEINSNTQITLDRNPTFSSNSATFSVTAAGKLTHQGLHWYTGRWWNADTGAMEEHSGHRVDMLRITETNANSLVRFVNNMVEAITINSGGTGYSNSDHITVYPTTNANTANADHISYIQSYANAIANVVTNSSGTITGIAVTNAGHGLISNAQISITTSGGTSANLSVTIGSKLRCETSNAIFANTVIGNIEVHRALPHLQFISNQHHSYKLYQHYPYYINAGTEHIIRKAAVAVRHQVDVLNNKNTLDIENNDGRSYVLASRSNEVMTSGNVTIKAANGSNYATSVKSSSLLEVAVTSNNAFTLPLVVADKVYNYKYIINNDAQDEHKGNGSAMSRHVSKRVNFAENRNAEDVLVYLDVHRPKGTSIKVYARIHAKADSEAFEDKDWTELQLQSNNASRYSSLTDTKDVIEFEYSLPNSPSTVNTISGSVTTTMSSANLVGVGTSWSTDLSNNDIIKISSPLFPENYAVRVASMVTNNTFIELDEEIDDIDIVGDGMKIELVGRTAENPDNEIGRPHQAWSNKPNSYVCRYYDYALSPHDAYNSFAIKIVLLSENTSIIPTIANIRAIGVSA